MEVNAGGNAWMRPARRFFRWRPEKSRRQGETRVSGENNREVLWLRIDNGYFLALTVAPSCEHT